MDYGSGAIFGCLGHDHRDFELAKKYNLGIIRVAAMKQKRRSYEAYMVMEKRLIQVF